MKGEDIIGIVIHIVSFLFGTIFSIFYCRNKKIHSFPLDIANILCLTCSLSHFFNVVWIFIEDPNLILRNICHSFFLFFNVIACFIISIMTFSILYNSINVSYIQNNKGRVIVIYGIIVLALSLPVLVLQLIQSTAKGAIYVYLVMVWISVVLNITFVSITAQKIMKNYELNQYKIKFTLYAVTPILMYIPGTIEMINILVSRSRSIWLSYLVHIVNGLKGTVFILVYGISIDFFTGMRETFTIETDSISYPDDSLCSVRYSDANNADQTNT